MRKLTDQERADRTHHREGFNRYGETVEQVRDRRLIVMVNDAEVEAIDEWRYRNRVETRAKAVRDLLEIALGRKGPANG
ncbi:hypothetical protein [Devosia elaeis]|uniref:Ribbon-helix-helix protein CopG domain-containing protein n=1 Tax=Devosia elaeis TaxID=1770058 RepID=A0A178I4D3_9HYPH|nr:hypothetical protein [Devosia elaeis]OAM84204.1 hypothetical protein A3840_00030 [Devosia elaeis]